VPLVGELVDVLVVVLGQLADDEVPEPRRSFGDPLTDAGEPVTELDDRVPGGVVHRLAAVSAGVGHHVTSNRRTATARRPGAPRDAVLRTAAGSTRVQALDGYIAAPLTASVHSRVLAAWIR